MANSELGAVLATIQQAVAKDAANKGAAKSAGLTEVKVDWKHVDTEIERTGKKIILPDDPGPMPIDDAIRALERKKKEEEQPFAVMEFIDGSPADAAIAFVKAMQQTYGWASPQSTPGFFGSRPPQMRSVRVGPGRDDFIQVPMGAFSIPGVSKNINTSVAGNAKGRPTFVVHGEVLKKEAHVVLDLVVKARDILQTESIYRGRAITLEANAEGQIDWFSNVSFIDVSVNTELLFNDDVMRQIETNLWAPLRHTDQCRMHKIPLKRGVLLEGPYGTGKSLTARATARIASENGWTFINLTNAAALRSALEFAEIYAPAVVFAEDIDRVMKERNERANDIVNTIDGVVSKKSEVITVLTTNHIELIEPVMLRPGRLDAIISVEKPDAKTAVKLVELYGRNLIAPGTDLSAAGEKLAGQIPATIREIVERSKLSMIALGQDSLTSEAIILSAESMGKHVRLLNGIKADKSREEIFYETFAGMIADTVKGATFDVAKLQHIVNAAVIDSLDLEGATQGYDELAAKVGVHSPK